MATFADKLSALMQAQQVSQPRLEELTGIGQTTLSTYVTGKSQPSWRNVQIIARALGVSCAELQDDGADTPKASKKKS